MRQLKITKHITQRTEEAISRYFQNINKYPMISAEEETELSIKIKTGDSDALERQICIPRTIILTINKKQ